MDTNESPVTFVDARDDEVRARLAAIVDSSDDAIVSKTLRLERREDGTVLLTAVAMVPETQLWTIEEPHRSRIERGLTWAAANPPQETDVGDLLRARTNRAKRVRARRR